MQKSSVKKLQDNYKQIASDLRKSESTILAVCRSFPMIGNKRSGGRTGQVNRPESASSGQRCRSFDQTFGSRICRQNLKNIYSRFDNSANLGRRRRAVTGSQNTFDTTIIEGDRNVR